MNEKIKRVDVFLVNATTHDNRHTHAYSRHVDRTVYISLNSLFV